MHASLTPDLELRGRVLACTRCRKDIFHLHLIGNQVQYRLLGSDSTVRIVEAWGINKDEGAIVFDHSKRLYLERCGA